MKRWLSLFISLVIILSSANVAIGQANDYESSWAKDEINYMKGKGIISGYPDGTFRPTNNMSKAEFYKVVNGIMGFTEKSEINFNDVTIQDWYYSEVQKGVKANYILPSTSLNANENITRGEVARIMGIVFDIEGDEAIAAEFADNLTLPKELKGVVGGLKKGGFIKGYPDGTFRPNAEITRAEVVKMLYNISGEIVNISDVLAKDIKTNLVVNKTDVILKDMTISGNLYLTEGIGEGSAILDNVTVEGKVIINGGGPNSVVIKNSDIKAMSINKQQGLVRVVVENTKVGEVKTVKQVKLEFTKGSQIKKVELNGKLEVVVEKDALIDNLNVVSKETNIDLQGTIKHIKSTKEINVNGTTLMANVEYKGEDGKVTEINPKSTSIPKSTSKPTPRPKPDSKPTPKPVTLTRILIKSPADKLVYRVGDELDITGLIIEGIYSDGSREIERITTANITGFDSRKPVARQTLTVTVGGKKTTYTVEIKANDPIDPDPNPIEVDKSALIEAIDEARGKNEEDYTPETWMSFRVALETAIGVMDDVDATQPEVDEALSELIARMNGLVEIEEPDPTEVDKLALIEAIDMAQSKNEEDYTPETWEIFEIALEDAIEVRDDSEATQSEVDEALENLNNAIEQLEEKEDQDPDPDPDPDPILSITNILPNEDITLKAGDILEVSFNAPERGEGYFRIFLPYENRVAKESTNNYAMEMEEVSPGLYYGTWVIPEEVVAAGLQIEVDYKSPEDLRIREMAEGRLTIIEEPVNPDPDPIVDKTALEEAIAEARRKNEEDYTQETWEPFALALAAAIEVKDNLEATQAEVDQALLELNTRMAALVEKEEPVDPEPTVTVEVRNSSNFIPALIQLKVDVENIPNSAKYDVVYTLSGGTEANTDKFNLGTWSTESIFFNPKTITDKVTIRIYDNTGENLLHIFTDVVLVNPMIPK